MASTASLGSPPPPSWLSAAKAQRPSGLAATPVGSPGTDTRAGWPALSLGPVTTCVEQPGTWSCPDARSLPEPCAWPDAEVQAATAHTVVISRHRPSSRSSSLRIAEPSRGLQAGATRRIKPAAIPVPCQLWCLSLGEGVGAGRLPFPAGIPGRGLGDVG